MRLDKLSRVIFNDKDDDLWGKKLQLLSFSHSPSPVYHKHSTTYYVMSYHVLLYWYESQDPYSNYPITLPWRPLGSGNPEILNEQEFAEEKVYDEKKIKSASELGLLEKNDEKKMILFKFPQKLPLDNKQTKRVPVSTKGKEKVDASNKFVYASGLNDLPDGHIGKMLVYKSGAIKFKLGDIIFDVSSGILDECAQDVALMNVKRKDCCVLGKVDNQAVVVPDLGSILDDIALQ